MEETLFLFFVLAFLLFILAFLVVAGHVIWLAIAWVLKKLFGTKPTSGPAVDSSSWLCHRCEKTSSARHDVCLNCSAPRPNRVVQEWLDDLAASKRTLTRLYKRGKVDEQTLIELTTLLETERSRHYGTLFSTTPPQSKTEPAQASISDIIANDRSAAFDPGPSKVTAIYSDSEVLETTSPTFLDQQPEAAPQPEVLHIPPAPAKAFTEVLNSFMEQSNIRWGEIIGGLLIIGCSTALTVSLWSEISRIPVLKFLIFTTVTAILFGVGLYTDHRWKLPTTSRGILTIATLLVPLNFLAIAAVSATSATGGLVILSELLAPAIFLCLVYFAGKIITPGCAQLLAAGILGSSVGQLLVRHFVAPDSNPLLLLLLGAFPVLCYVVTVGLVLRNVLSDAEIDESETTIVFTILGTMSFAALLPFGLLLYRAGTLSLTMMYLAPLVTVWGMPMLATGTLMWRRIHDRRLVASRTVGTALALLGAMIVLAGMILAWPNPASIVPAALLNFAVFTALAIVLELPAAHAFAALCLSLAYLVLFQVFAGSISWSNLRVVSLLKVSLSVGSGQSLMGMFVLCLVASERLAQLKRQKESLYYVFSACVIAVVSLTIVTLSSLGSSDTHAVWLVYGVYSLGAFWIAWRRSLSPFSWVASALLLISLVGLCGQVSFRFPWQTALLMHATVCAIGAVLSWRFRVGNVIWKPLNLSAIISSILTVVCLLQANPWQVTSMQAERVFWLSGIWLVTLWLSRAKILFIAFQIALTVAFVLTVKATLQQYEWYSYLPHAFLHPWALQIQGTILILLCLLWASMRLAVRKIIDTWPIKPSHQNWLRDSWKLLDDELSVDRILLWALPVALLLLAFYGSLSGLLKELSTTQLESSGLDVAGFPHSEALGLGSWILMGLLTVTMLVTCWERRRQRFLLGAVVTLSAVIPLVAGRFENQLATATAWRWSAGFFLLAGSFLIWNRARFAQLINVNNWIPDYDLHWGRNLRNLLLATALTPLLLLTFWPALLAVLSIHIHHPVSGFFALFDDEVLYGFPFLLTGVVLIGYSVRDRIAGYAFSAGLFLNLAVTIAYLMSVAAINGSMNRVVLVKIIQLNAIVVATYALLWLGWLRRRRLDEPEESTVSYWFNVQRRLLVFLNATVIIPAVVALAYTPGSASIGTFAVGSGLGWVALILSVFVVISVTRRAKKKISATELAAILLAVGYLTALTTVHQNVDTWTGLHALLVANEAVAMGMLLLSGLNGLLTRPGNPSTLMYWSRDLFQTDGKWPYQCRKAFVVIASLAVFLALRISVDEPSSHYWPIVSLSLLGVMFALLNWQTLKRRHIYISGILFSLAASIWWFRFLFEQFPSAISFLETNIIIAMLTSIPLLYLELRSRRLSNSYSSVGLDLSFHNVAGWLSLITLSLLVLIGFSTSYSELTALVWFAIASTVALMAASLFDREAKHATAALYLLGLMAGLLGLQQLSLTSSKLAWSLTLFLAVYAIGTSLLWHYRNHIFSMTRRVGIPDRVDSTVSELKWLAAFNIVIVGVVVGFTLWIDLAVLDWALRVTAALAVMSQLFTFILLADVKRRDSWYRAAFVSFFLGLVLVGWAWLNPSTSGTWLNRDVVLMVTCFLFTGLYSLSLNRIREAWPNVVKPSRDCLPWVVAAGFLSLGLCLATEVFYRTNFGTVNISAAALIVIGLTLIAIAVAAVLFALSSSHDPLGLTGRTRMIYVYVAELMTALLFLHVRLTMPWLFTGFFTRYWPLAVMAVAYLGVVASEALRRRSLLVLSEPMERTGAFLPLLPVMGFWLARSEVDYSSLLFIVGGLYGLLSILRRSFIWGILAAVAGNGGLWYWLHRTSDYQFFQHPQLWLVPVAVSTLLAAYLNEENLTDDQLTGLRYMSLVTIYVSSTADIFLNGVANSPWLPLILGAFSVAGVFSGIIFRIRGLLLLGSVFLLLAIVTMIWYASANLGWTWLWYVAGIATGATIIFMFAVFEKKRGEVLRMVEGLKEWER